MEIRDRVLVIAAHMDDEVLGVGGTISKHKNMGDLVSVCYVTDSSTCQYDGDEEKLNLKYDESKRVKAVLGIDEQFWLDFPDMKLDTVTISEIAKGLSGIVEKLDPTIIYTHASGDLNKDHRLIHEASLIAARPISSSVFKIYNYEVPSSTEWGLTKFNPNTYSVLSEKNLEKKMKALEQYTLELRDPPHPRSLEGIKILAQHRGMAINKEYAEAFELVRYIR